MKNTYKIQYIITAAIKFFAVFEYTEHTAYYRTGQVQLLLADPPSLPNPTITLKAPASVSTAKVANHYGLNYTGGAAESISGKLVPELQNKWTVQNPITLRFGIQLSNAYEGSDFPYQNLKMCRCY